jgi:Flp pilus assembly protein TadD
VLRSLKRDADAVAYFQKCLDTGGEQAVLLEQLALLKATSRIASVYNPQKALVLARKLNRLSDEPEPERLSTLAITEAENEDFVAAKKPVRRALSLARQTGNQRVIGMLLRQLDLYEQRRKPSEGFR